MVFIEIRHGSVREGTRCARHLPYQDPHEAHHNRDAALNCDAARHVATNASPQQEAVLIHLGLYPLGQHLEPFAQGGNQLHIARVIALGVHVAVGLAALEVQADIVEGGIRVSVGLGVVVPPEVAARIQHRLRLGREDHGLFGYQTDALREKVARFTFFPAEPAREEVGHEMGLELLLGVHLVLGVGDPVVDALRAADTVLAVEQGEGQAVVVEL